jgi:cytochrome c553
MYKLPGTDKTFLRSQISDPFGPADWYPNDHPPMPDIVAHGRKMGATVNDSIRACGLCHMPNGKGRLENSSVSGLPVSYFVQQMHDFKNGLRTSSEPRKGNSVIMAKIGKDMTEEEIKAAAEYFAAIKWTGRYIRVVEGNTVPKFRVLNGVNFVLEGAEAGTEPIGQRIIEMPEHNEHFEVLRDPKDGFVAYVPAGAIRRAKRWSRRAETGDLACGVLATGRTRWAGPGASPRDVLAQHARPADVGHEAGHPQGRMGSLMKPVVQGPTNEEHVNILAYDTCARSAQLDQLNRHRHRVAAWSHVHAFEDCTSAIGAPSRTTPIHVRGGPVPFCAVVSGPPSRRPRSHLLRSQSRMPKPILSGDCGLGEAPGTAVGRWRRSMSIARATSGSSSGAARTAASVPH